MAKNLFIADTHFGHKNTLAFDENLPFETIEEYDNSLINNWNAVTDYNDHVYILGDFSWYNATKTTEILKSLNGIKHLILGNHDEKFLRNKDVRFQFETINNYLELPYGEGAIILCHYPIPSYKNHYYPNYYHLYAHVHNTWEEQLTRQSIKAIWKAGKRCKAYNCGAMIDYMNFTPQTFEHIKTLGDEKYAI